MMIVIIMVRMIIADFDRALSMCSVLGKHIKPIVSSGFQVLKNCFSYPLLPNKLPQNLAA